MGHFDIKPENILLTDEVNRRAKIIDIGNMMKFSNKAVHGYFISRYYRPPEVVLDLPLSDKADVWSLGCVLAEIVQGCPLFPGKNQHELLKLMTIRKSQSIPIEMIKLSPKRKEFFDENSSFLKLTIDQFVDSINADEEDEFLKNNLKDLLKKMLEFEPSKRYSINDVLKHKFFQ